MGSTPTAGTRKEEVKITIDALTIARIRAAEDKPYLATAIWNLIPVERKGLGTLAIDKYWRLYYDPMLDWTPEELSAVLQHEVWHNLRDHSGRADTKGIDTPEKGRLWNVCGDAEINDDLRDEGVKLPKGCVYPQVIGQKDYGMAEEYYDALRKKGEGEGDGQGKGKGKGTEKGKGGGSGTGDQKGPHGDSVTTGKGDCGSCADGMQREYEVGPPSDEVAGITPMEGELIARDVARQILESSQTRGQGAGGMERWAQDVLNPKIAWEKELTAIVRHAREDKAGEVDFSYCRPSRKQYTGAGNVIFPSMREPIVNLNVYIDTSGSMSEGQLAQAVAEVQGVLKRCNFDSVPVAPIDDEIYGMQKVQKSRRVNLRGGGGTDMGKAIVHAQGLQKKPDVILILTDGYTPWPDEPPRGFKVVVGILRPKDQMNQNFGGYDVPKWARKVEIPIDEES